MPHHSEDSLEFHAEVQCSDPDVGINSEVFIGYETGGDRWCEITEWSDDFDKVTFTWFNNNGTPVKRPPFNYRAIEHALHGFALGWYERVLG